VGELKNAWEIAQERVNRLGKLSDGEREKQARQRYEQIGRAVAQNWLDGSPTADIATELNKYEEEEKDMIKKATVEHLMEPIEFSSAQDINRIKKAIQGINSLCPELQPHITAINKLIGEYERAEEKIKQELESKYKDSLHQLRISGTAVGAINTETTLQWQTARQKLSEVFSPMLHNLKQKAIAANPPQTI